MTGRTLDSNRVGIRSDAVQRGSEGFSRTLTFGLTFLVGLLLTVGLLSAWFFKKIDKDYSRLLARTAADLDAVHDIAFHSGLSYANIVSLPLAREPEKRAELLRVIAQERAANDKVFEKLGRATTDSETKASLEEVIAKRRIFRNESDTFIASTSSNQNPASGIQGSVSDSQLSTINHQPTANYQPTHSSSPLLAAFIDYQKSCDKLCDRIQATSRQLTDQITKEVGRLRTLFFGLGIFPIGLALALILLTFYLISSTPIELDLREETAATPDRKPKPESRLLASAPALLTTDRPNH